MYISFLHFFYKEWNNDVDLDIAHGVKMYNHTGLVSRGFSFVIVPLCFVDLCEGYMETCG